MQSSLKEDNTLYAVMVGNSSIFDPVTQFIYLSTVQMNVRIIEQFITCCIIISTATTFHVNNIIVHKIGKLVVS